MRIPLLVGANPKAVVQGPTVPVSSGRWRVVMAGVVNSRIHLYHNSPNRAFEAIDGWEFDVIDTPEKMFTKVTEKGTEHAISVYLERIGEPHSSQSDRQVAPPYRGGQHRPT
jgi:hypothetical protein